MARRSVGYYNSIKVYRREWKAKHPQKCMYCGDDKNPLKLEIHEIERRSQATNKWWPIDGCNGLLLCNHCHQTYFSSMPHVKQLAVKKKMDPVHYNLRMWLRIRPRPLTYVTEYEVDVALREMYK